MSDLVFKAPYCGVGAKEMAENRRLEKEAATAAASAKYADPRQSTPVPELRAEWERLTGQRECPLYLVKLTLYHAPMCNSHMFIMRITH